MTSSNTKDDEEARSISETSPFPPSAIRITLIGQRDGLSAAGDNRYLPKSRTVNTRITLEGVLPERTAAVSLLFTKPTAMIQFASIVCKSRAPIAGKIVAPT
jgi:hypothetical protein